MMLIAGLLAVLDMIASGKRNFTGFSRKKL
jgi:hypothetical protein